MMISLHIYFTEDIIAPFVQGNKPQLCRENKKIISKMCRKYWILKVSCGILVRYSALGLICAVAGVNCLFFVNCKKMLDRFAKLTL